MNRAHVGSRPVPTVFLTSTVVFIVPASAAPYAVGHPSKVQSRLAHEFGHAVYDKYVNPQLPCLLRTFAHPSSTEAIALMTGGLVDEPAWLSPQSPTPPRMRRARTGSASCGASGRTG